MTLKKTFECRSPTSSNIDINHITRATAAEISCSADDKDGSCSQEWVDPQLKMSGKHMLQVFFVAAKQVDVRWLMFVCCVVVCSGHVNSEQTSANHNPRRAHHIWVSGSAGGWRCLWCLCQSWKVESSKLPISTRCLKITPPFMVPPHEIKRLIDTPSYLWRDCQQLGQAIGKRFCGELQDPRNQRNQILETQRKYSKPFKMGQSQGTF